MRIRSHGGWWLKTHARNPPASLPWSPSISMLGAEEEKESNVTLIKNERVLQKCNQIFPGNNRIHLNVETYTYHQNDSPQGTSVDGWRKTKDRVVKSQSRVLCPGEQARVRSRPVPPLQGPGGRCPGTDGRDPSSSSA